MTSSPSWTTSLPGPSCPQTIPHVGGQSEVPGGVARSVRIPPLVVNASSNTLTSIPSLNPHSSHRHQTLSDLTLCSLLQSQISGGPQYRPYSFRTKCRLHRQRVSTVIPVLGARAPCCRSLLIRRVITVFRGRTEEMEVRGLDAWCERSRLSWLVCRESLYTGANCATKSCYFHDSPSTKALSATH